MCLCGNKCSSSSNHVRWGVRVERLWGSLGEKLQQCDSDPFDCIQASISQIFIQTLSLWHGLGAVDTA